VLADSRGYGMDNALEKTNMDSMTYMMLDFEANPGKWQDVKKQLRFHIFETEDEWLYSIVDVVRAVNRMENENVHLVIKLHPGIFQTYMFARVESQSLTHHICEILGK
jgi:hypothetical protein